MNRRDFYLVLGTIIGIVLGTMMFLVPTVRAVQNQQQQPNQPAPLFPIVVAHQGVVR